jgi:hypothetical protein
MDTTLSVGGLLTALSVVGYVAGVLGPYPGRAFSLTGLTVGIALLAIGAGREWRDTSAGGGERP